MLFWRGVEVFMQRVLTFKIFVYLRLTQPFALKCRYISLICSCCAECAQQQSEMNWYFVEGVLL